MIIVEKFNKFFGDVKLTLATEIPKLKYCFTTWKKNAAMISIKILSNRALWRTVFCSSLNSPEF